MGSFAPRARYISFDALKRRWAGNQFCRSEKRAVEAIRARVAQSRLADYVPGEGFSQLTDAESKSHPPPEWALFSLVDVNDIEAEDFAEVDNLPDKIVHERGAMTRKVIFGLAPNEVLIPADQIPGAIADALYPRPDLDGGPGLNDPDTVPRLLAEREHAKMLRTKFPHLKDSDKFSIGDLNDYLARLGIAAELRHRREVPAPLDPENRWSRRQFEDAFNAVREPVVEAQRSASELSAERCTELAGLREIFLDHWIELVGWGIGQHESYDIGDGGVTFRKWQDDFISAAPVKWQAEMKRDNRTAPRLEFPCTPAELVEFVDTAIGIHCFMVPDAFRLAVASNTQAERCNELATLPELFVHHWEELTGIGICKGGAYIVSQSGVYPEQYSDDDLRSLFPEERRLLLERATRLPLRFPCTPSQLLKFVDGGSQGEFEVPEEFRTAVEPDGQLPPKDSEQNVSFGASECVTPPLKKRRDTRGIALLKDLEGKVTNMTIECIWLYIRQNAGKEGSLFATASNESATATDGGKILKKNLGRSLLRYLKNNTTTNKVQTTHKLSTRH